ncbi:MAG: hypothetical protein ABR607_03330 [Pyrinomonadaceae bacterium]
MHRELKDNTNFDTNVETDSRPPLPPEAHFDMARIEAAKPVEPLLSARELNRSRAPRMFGGPVGWLAVAAVVVLIAGAFAASFIHLRSGSPVTETSVATQNTSVESGTPEPAAVSVEKPQTRFFGQDLHKDSLKDSLIKSDKDPDKEPDKNSPKERSYRANRKMVRATNPVEVTDQSKGKPKARLVTVIH